MRSAVFVFFCMALLACHSALAAATPQKQSNQDVCQLCAQSYIDCFVRFGASGCSDHNAEHYTWCRECTGSDPMW